MNMRDIIIAKRDKNSLTDEQIKELAYKCSFFGTRRIGGFKILDQEDMVRIYEAARGI